MKLLIAIVALCIVQCLGLGELIGYAAQTGNYRVNRFPLNYYKKLIAARTPPPVIYPGPLEGPEIGTYGNGHFSPDTLETNPLTRLTIQSQKLNGRYFNAPVDSNLDGQPVRSLDDDSWAEFLEENQKRDTSEWGIFPNTSNTLHPPCWPLDTRPQCVGYGR